MARPRNDQFDAPTILAAIASGETTERAAYIAYAATAARPYPSIAVQLPSMEGGKWVYKKNPTCEEIESSNILSMFKIRTRNFSHDLRFYPLFFRNENGGVMFPPNLPGARYMRDDAIAAFKFFDQFKDDGLADFTRWGAAPEIVVSEAMFFVPGDHASRPLAFIHDLFDERARLVANDKNDVRGQVIKLGLNAVYGKLSQRNGKPGEPPAYACLWYAAAITAGTRRKLIEAALTDPKAVVAFATDAVFSTRALPLDVPPTKILGEWEFEKAAAISVIQSGVYAYRLDCRAISLQPPAWAYGRFERKRARRS